MKFKILSLAAFLVLATKAAADPDPNFHIYLCFGQSNMESGARMEEMDRTVDKRFQVLADFDAPNRGWKKGNWYDAVPPLTARGTGLSLVDYFGRTMVANLPEKVRVGVVKVSVPGTKIELWDKDAYTTYLSNLPPADSWKITATKRYNGNPYQFLIDLAKIAQKDGVIKGILIHQGESNFEDPDWPKKVKKIYGDLMKDLNLKAENVILLAGEVVNADHQGEKAAFNDILKKLPETLPNSYAISSAGLPCNPDHLHFTSAGLREFGKRYGEKMLSVMALAVNAPVPGAPDQTATQAAAPGGRRGGRQGGAPLTAEDQAAIAKLGELPEWKAGVGDGDYAISPPFNPAPENTPRDNVLKGKVVTFKMDLAESNFYPPSPGRGGNATNREVVVYIPAQYVPGTPAPLLLAHDAMGAHDQKPAPYLPDILDNLIAEKRVPAMVAVMVMPSNQRSLEYDTVSGKYAEFIEAEVLPRVAKDYNITFTKDPDARATLGGSSGGAVALSMAWFHPELYHRVFVYSGTFVNLRNGPDAPHGAWEYHENFIPNTTPSKPLRIWLEVGEKDNGATSSDAGMHNWVLANMHMAQVLKAKGYHYQFVYAKEAGHVDRPVRAMTVAPALEWLWK